MCNGTDEYRLVELFKEKGWHISFAESCTGGLCAARLIGVPDASYVLEASVVTYSNQSKTDYLGVPADMIERYGVVSEEVACEMAKGVALRNNAEVGVGISGIAGPLGGSRTKPVGTVCFGFKIGDEVYSVTKLFSGMSRNEVRSASADYVFQEILQFFKK